MKEKRGRKAKQVALFDGPEYRITNVPLNFQIEAKVMVAGKGKWKGKKGKKVKLISDEFYSPSNRGVEYAHETAKYIIESYQKEASVHA